MNRSKSKQIVIRLSEQDYETVKKKVAQSGMKQQEYLTRAITQKEVVSTDGLKEFLPDLKRIGNNLNQIAHHCNENDPVNHDEVVQIGKELNEVWQLLRLLIQGRVSPPQ